MAEMNIKLKGWQAVVALVVLVGLLGLRFMTFRDRMDDATLVRELETQIMLGYMPDVLDRLEQAMDSGDEQGGIGNSWRYRRDASALSYYLNFI